MVSPPPTFFVISFQFFPTCTATDPAFSVVSSLSYLSMTIQIRMEHLWLSECSQMLNVNELKYVNFKMYVNAKTLEIPNFYYKFLSKIQNSHQLWWLPSKPPIRWSIQVKYGALKYGALREAKSFSYKLTCL